MAKNNTKPGVFLKTDDVVFLSDVGNQNCAEKTLNSSGKRCMPTRSSSMYHFQTTAPTSTAITKTPVLTKPIAVATTAIPIISRSIEVPIKCDSVTLPLPTNINVPVVPRQIRQPAARVLPQCVKRKAEEKAISIISEKAAPYPGCNIKKDVSSVSPNGQIISQIGVGRRVIPSDLTITPISDKIALSSSGTVLVDSPKVVCKQVPTVTGTALQLINKTVNVKESTVGLAPNTSVFQKESFFIKPSVKPVPVNSETCYRHTIGSKVVLLTEKPATPTRGRPRGSKNKVAEPVILTLSSDDEEPADDELSAASGQNLVQQQLLRNCNLSVVNNSQVNDGLAVDMNPFVKRDPLHMGIHRDDEDKELEESMVEDEEMDEEDEESLESSMEELNSNSELVSDNILLSETGEKPRTILCRSVRFGSFKIHPVDDSPHISIFVTPEGFQFRVRTVSNAHEMVTVVLKENDIQQVLGHFGRCLPILFIFTTPACGEKIRKQLHMIEGDLEYFDPEGQDDRQKIITFLIDTITDDIKNFLRNVFPGEGMLKELDQKVANEILVKSTPQAQQNPVPTPNSKKNPITYAAKSITPAATTTTTTTTGQNTVPVTAAVSTSPIQVKMPVITQAVTQVVKILTYPPPPQTGGITITSEDMLCLDEGEFLNDAIIDFYLKYLVNEKLSEADRKRTHVFSSYFYPRLTQKSTRVKTAEEAGSKTAVRRHAQVKTWTKNVDIFEKDFIIIPINQNVHWFLAIICFPWMVPDSPPSPKNSSKAVELVSSTNGEAGENGEDNMQMEDTAAKTNKESLCCNDDQSSDDGSLSNDVESNFTEEPIPDSPDSSTHPDRNAHHDKMPCILIFDSLSGPNRWRIVNHLREYLDMEWKIRKETARSFTKNSITGHITTVPQQTNFSDCGIYVLQYVESFFENPFPYFANHMPPLADWFPPEKVFNKRAEIKDLIYSLRDRQASSTQANPRTAVARKDVEKSTIVAALPSSSLQTNRLPTS